MVCIQACVFILLYVASCFEVLSNDRVMVCPTIDRVIRLLASHPSYHRVSAVGVGFSGSDQRSTLSTGNIYQRDREDSGKTVGGMVRSLPVLVFPDWGYRTGAIPTCSECGLNKVLLFGNSGDLFFWDHTLLQIQKYVVFHFFQTKYDKVKSEWSYPLTWAILFYPWNVYLWPLIFLLVWMCLIIKDLEIGKSTKVKIYQCAQVSYIWKMVSSSIIIKLTIKYT